MKKYLLLLSIGLPLLNCSFFQDPLIGTWKYLEYCVYKSDDCDGNCNYQQFIPIVYSYSSFPIGSQVRVITTIGSDDLIINDDLQGVGKI